MESLKLLSKEHHEPKTSKQESAELNKSNEIIGANARFHSILQTTQHDIRTGNQARSRNGALRKQIHTGTAARWAPDDGAARGCARSPSMARALNQLRGQEERELGRPDEEEKGGDGRRDRKLKKWGSGSVDL